MWYVTFVKHFAQQACDAPQETISVFIDHFYYLLSKHLYNRHPLEPLEALGFIKDLHFYTSKFKSKTLTLSVFGRECLGLVMLHIKSAQDNYVYSQDFVEIIKDRQIFDYLQINELIDNSFPDFFYGKMAMPKKIYGYLFNKNLKKHDAAMIPEKIYKRVLNALELEAYVRLNYIVSTNVAEFAFILCALLPKIKNDFETVSNLSNFLLHFKNHYAKFNEPTGSDEFDKFTTDLQEIGCELSTSILADILKPLQNYVMNEQLQHYAFFYSQSPYQYVNEVSQIIKQIMAGEFRNVMSIIASLNHIKINNPNDKLGEIVQFIGQRYSDIHGTFTYA